MLKFSGLSKVINILSVIVLISIIFLGMFTWNSTDDYCISIRLSENSSIFSFLKEMYFMWDGRFISLSALIQSILIKFLPVEAATMFWALFLILCAFLINKILSLELTSWRFNLYPQLMNTAIISIVLWHGMKAHIAETVYWTTGGIYIFNNFIGLLWIFLLYKATQNTEKSLSNFGIWASIFSFFLFSIIAGMTSYNLATALILLNIIVFLIFILRRKKTIKNITLYILASVGLILGAYIIYSAPGNFIRADQGSGSFQFDMASILHNIKFVFLWNMNRLFPIVSFSIFSGFLFSVMSTIQNSSSKEEDIVPNLRKRLTIGESFKWILDNLKWILAALATLIPFIAVPWFLSERTMIFFQTFVTLFLMSFSFRFFKKIFSSSLIRPLRSIQTILAQVLIVSLCLFHLVTITNHILLAKNIRAQLKERHIYLSNIETKNRIIKVRPIYGKIPISMKFTDITDDEKDWKNSCMSGYYNLKGVKLRGKRNHE
ncbi:DUF6056 family protein [Acidobacteriota bacterium]